MMFAPVKTTPPEKARPRRRARQVIHALTFQGCRIRGNQVLRVGPKYTEGVYYSGCRYVLPDGVMAVLAPHLETFIDLDGKDSMRISEDGIAATATRGR